MRAVAQAVGLRVSHLELGTIPTTRYLAKDWAIFRWRIVKDYSKWVLDMVLPLLHVKRLGSQIVVQSARASVSQKLNPDFATHPLAAQPRLLGAHGPSESTPSAVAS